MRLLSPGPQPINSQQVTRPFFVLENARGKGLSCAGQIVYLLTASCTWLSTTMTFGQPTYRRRWPSKWFGTRKCSKQEQRDSICRRDASSWWSIWTLLRNSQVCFPSGCFPACFKRCGTKSVEFINKVLNLEKLFWLLLWLPFLNLSDSPTITVIKIFYKQPISIICSNSCLNTKITK